MPRVGREWIEGLTGVVGRGGGVGGWLSEWVGTCVFVWGLVWGGCRVESDFLVDSALLYGQTLAGLGSCPAHPSHSPLSSRSTLENQGHVPI